VYSSIADLSFIWFTRHAAARWLTGLVRQDKGWFVGAKLALAKHWVALALIFEVVMSAVQYYGSISGNTEVSLGLSTTLQAILIMLLIESAMDLPRRLADAAAASAGAVRKPGVGELVADMVLVYARLTFILSWCASGRSKCSPCSPPEQYADIRYRNIATGLMIFSAYAVWKIASFMIDRAMSSAPTFVKPGDEDAVQQPQGAASRVYTVLPLLRATIAVVIFVLLLLLVLSQLGVNITPLIAGASVLGLAISFGSQTLVKDIVSGIFYLIDDAFRVGDYVDTGRVKGTVEGFTLRSIKMRPPERPDPHHPVRPARHHHQLQPRLGDGEIQPAPGARRRPGEGAQDREEDRPGDDGRQGPRAGDAGAAQAAGRGRHRRQRAGAALQVHLQADQPEHHPAPGDQEHYQTFNEKGIELRELGDHRADRRRPGRSGSCAGRSGAPPRRRLPQRLPPRPSSRARALFQSRVDTRHHLLRHQRHRAPGERRIHPVVAGIEQRAEISRVSRNFRICSTTLLTLPAITSFCVT
jgi:small-conductance mechanosensitive channel